MTLPLALLTAALLASLAALHVYWALGGTAGLHAALPQHQSSGQPIFRPGRALTLAVAAGLLGASGVTALLALHTETPLLRWAALALGVGFAARGVGDFRVMGLFKRLRGTRFAALDDRVYTPLCLALAASLLWLGLGAPR